MNTEERIWSFLKAQGLTDAGAAGLMGNLYAESGLRPNNLQNSYEGKLGMADAEYTERVDSGSYTNFAHDCAGYGLAQWTYHTRKANLHKFAKDAGKSIGDLEMQLGYSHPVLVEAPEGIAFEVPSQTEIVVSGPSKEQVGQVAANIRKWRKPEPYKGKGIRYEGEHVRRKAGKAGKD